MAEVGLAVAGRAGARPADIFGAGAAGTRSFDCTGGYGAVAHCPELDALTGHVRAFGRMITELQGDRLPQ